MQLHRPLSFFTPLGLHVPDVPVGKRDRNNAAVRGLAAERHIVVKVEMMIDRGAWSEATDIADATEIIPARILVADGKRDFARHLMSGVGVGNLRTAGLGAHVLRHGDKALLNGNRRAGLRDRSDREREDGDEQRWKKTRSAVHGSSPFGVATRLLRRRFAGLTAEPLLALSVPSSNT